MNVEIVFALPEKCWELTIDVDEGTTVAVAVGEALRNPAFGEVKHQRFVGYAIWGQEVVGTYVLQDDDRIELLRPLHEHPMDRRRRLASAS